MLSLFVSFDSRLNWNFRSSVTIPNIITLWKAIVPAALSNLYRDLQITTTDIESLSFSILCGIRIFTLVLRLPRVLKKSF